MAPESQPFRQPSVTPNTALQWTVNRGSRRSIPATELQGR